MGAKSIIINSDEIHHKFKMLCKGRNLKIGGVIEDLMILYLDDHRKIDKLIEEVKVADDEK